MSDSNAESQHEGSIIETIQSLIFAFVLAMAFRGFVLEGFVIPTGSMAPTLLGEHVLLHSEETGYDFQVDAQTIRYHARQLGGHVPLTVEDPMIGPGKSNKSATARNLGSQIRMGDRVLVLKFLYPFFSPKRWDVVVFKNPCDPVGDTQNYIKRLIGLPGETIWLADGDVFARTDDNAPFQIQRKPEHVQRTVWQPVYDSDFIHTQPGAFQSPWIGGPEWTINDTRAYVNRSSGPTGLRWDNDRRSINDWSAYNMHRGRAQTPLVPISDIRVAAAIEADFSKLVTALEIRTRRHRFQFHIGRDGAGTSGVTLRIRDAETDVVEDESIQAVRLPEGPATLNIEFWHADQMMTIFIEGQRVAELPYDWSPEERLANAVFGRTMEQYLADPRRQLPTPPEISWAFEGSPLTLHRVQLDRDIHYRATFLKNDDQDNKPVYPDAEGGYDSFLAFGTDPREPARLGPDQFMMLGDNSPASKDSRLWGAPHELVKDQIDDAPFVVHRKLLLGKAWLVYFPAPYRPFLPFDTGRVRFIR